MVVTETSNKPATPPSVTRAKWAHISGVVFLVVVVMTAFVTARTSAGPKIADTNVSAVQPLWGITFWPRIFEWACIIVTSIMWAVLIRQSRRAGSLTPVTVAMAATTLLVLLDPTANWAPYVAYDKATVHFPEHMWWASVAPSAEPLVAWVGYSWFFILPGLIAIALYRKWAAAKPATSFIRKHPLFTLLMMAWAVCIPWDAGVEMFLVRLPLYTYTQVVPWMSVFGGRWYQFPILIESTTFGLVLACAAPLMWRDDAGTTINDRLSARTPLLRRWPNAGPIIVATLILSVAYIAYIIPYVAIRGAGLATETAKPWPYSHQAVYDPQGYYEKGGQPGRKYVGTWGGWEMRSK